MIDFKKNIPQGEGNIYANKTYIPKRKVDKGYSL